MKILHFKVLVFSLSFFLANSNLISQSAGNYYRARSTQDEFATSPTRNYINDSTFEISASIMYYSPSDRFEVVLGINQIGKTLIEAERDMQRRIDLFLDEVENSNINISEVIHIDFISQRILYGYSLNEEKTELAEVPESYSLNKNIIIQFYNHDLLNRIMPIASKYGIYDLVKVNYFNSDRESIQDTLSKMALKLIKNKHNKYQLVNPEINIVNPIVYNESFKSFEPSLFYTDYEVDKSTTLEYPRNYFDKTGIITRETYIPESYFFKRPTEGTFDKVVNSELTEPCTIYSYMLTIRYSLK